MKSDGKVKMKGEGRKEITDGSDEEEPEMDMESIRRKLRSKHMHTHAQHGIGL